ncbi:MAG: hypothetical protein AAB377_02335 [Patescibacteria group bacterium]
MSNFTAWIRENRVRIVFWLGLAIIASLAFGLGYLTAGQANPAPIIIQKNSR